MRVLVLRLEGVVVRATRQQGERLLETAIDRVVLRLESQVPLPGHAGEVPAVRKELWQRHYAAIQISFVSWPAGMGGRCPRDLLKLAEACDMVIGS